MMLRSSCSKSKLSKKRRIAELVQNDPFFLKHAVSTVDKSDSCLVESLVDEAEINDLENTIDKIEEKIDDENDFEEDENYDNELINDIIFENEELTQQQANEELVCASIFAVFYSGNISQSALSLVSELTRLFTGIKIPKKFDQILKKNSSNNISYKKLWYCSNCKKE